MNDLYSELSELKETCETLFKELRIINEKIRSGNGNLSPDDAQYLDHITHSMISTKKAIKMIEDKMYDGSYNSDGYIEWNNNRGYNDGWDGPNNMSYGARGRGSGANRDSMGRYRDSGAINSLKNMMNNAPTERARRALSEAIQEMERPQ